MHVTNRRIFPAVEAGVVLLDAFRRVDSSAFAWREPPYEYEYVKLPIDILSGSARLREALESGVDPRSLAAEWRPDVADFMRVRERFLAYPS
jgi:uncharacterized protein YbbC (DUF1343 family)